MELFIHAKILHWTVSINELTCPCETSKISRQCGIGLLSTQMSSCRTIVILAEYKLIKVVVLGYDDVRNVEMTNLIQEHLTIKTVSRDPCTNRRRE